MLLLVEVAAAAQKAAEPVTASEFMIHAYTSVIVAFLGVIASLLAYLQARVAAKHADATKELASEIRIRVNGRLDELVKTAREAGHQHGRLEGVMEERNRRGEGI